MCSMAYYGIYGSAIFYGPKTGFADAPWTYNGPATANRVKYSFFGMHTGKRCTTEHL
jgi:hypothetical protein